MKKKYTAFLLVLATVISLCVGCSGNGMKELEIKEYSGFGDMLSLVDNAIEIQSEPNSMGFSIWSYQLADGDDAKDYLKRIKDYGFETIDFSVLWSDFEVEENKYNWTFIDEVMDVFVEEGYKLNLSIVFWTYNLPFAEKLDLQENAVGEIYAYDEVRSSFLCLSSDKNLRYMEDAILAFASHVYDRYAENILSWQIKLSELGEVAFSSTVDLDYSQPSFEAFLGYVKNKYNTIKKFNSAYKTSYKSWEQLESEKKTKITSVCEYDWKLFKQNTLVSVQKIATDVFKAVAPNVPVIFRVGTVGDSMSAVFRGIFDPYTVALNSGSDIIQSDYFTDLKYNFYLDMMTYTTGKALSFEVNGPWQGAEEMEKTLLIAEAAGRTGIASLTVSNWTKTDIAVYGETYLSRYDDLFKSENQRKDPDVTDIIIINTLDFIIRQPPSSIYEIYKNAYRNMSGKSERKVIFLTDTQVIENPTLLDGVKKIHLGALNNVTYMYDELGKILAEGKYVLVDDDNQQPNFINQYSEPLDIEVQTELRERLEKS